MKSKNFALLLNCPNCGSYMVYKVGSFTLECINCKSKKAINTQKFISSKKELKKYHSIHPITQEIDCPSCGANNIFKEFELSKRCSYCKAPLIIQAQNDISINALLPFEIDRVKAQKIFKNWLGNLWFAPNALKKLLDFEHQFKGVYLPFFSFDSQTFSNYIGARGDAYYVQVQKEVIIDGKAQIVTELERRIAWSDVEGRVYRDFNNILVEAQKEKTLAKWMKNYDLNLLISFNPAFLSGFESVEYSIEPDIAFVQAKEYMKQIIYKDVLQDIGGDEQRVYDIQSYFNNNKFELYMLPCYISSYKYKNKEYQVVINGATGEIIGNRPYSYVKIILLVIIIGVILASLFYLDERFDNETTNNYRFNLPATRY